MKRNTTPTLTVKINLPLDSVKRIEFIFKEEISKEYPALIHKKLEKADFKLKDENTTECFHLLLSFTTEETMLLPEGDVYMDTLIELNGGIVPETVVVRLNVNETLFEEVYKSGTDKHSGASDG